MPLRNLSLEELLSEGYLGNLQLTSPDDFVILDQLIEDGRGSYAKGYQDGLPEGYDDGEQEGRECGYESAAEDYEYEIESLQKEVRRLLDILSKAGVEVETSVRH